jgi:hypothetical protein
MLAGQPPALAGNLMERGAVHLADAPATQFVQRGMSLVLKDGCVVGYVAAVMVDSVTRQVTHLLLLRRCSQPQYQVVAVQAIARIDDQQIRLHLAAHDVDGLPAWHPGC